MSAPKDPAAASSTPVVALSGVSKNYHGLRPLRIEALTLAAGERLALLGLDAPMAETLINLITGATLPDHGEVTVFGRSTVAIDDTEGWLDVVDRFGVVSARAVLLEGLSVIQNLALPFTVEIDPPPDDVRDRAATLAREVGILEADWPGPVGQLDEGARARLRLARALALDPAVLIVEHAAAGLSSDEKTGLAAVIRGVAAKRGLAVLTLSADEDFATAAAPRVLRLEPATGRLVEARLGFLARIFSRPA